MAVQSTVLQTTAVQSRAVQSKAVQAAAIQTMAGQDPALAAKASLDASALAGPGDAAPGSIALEQVWHRYGSQAGSRTGSRTGSGARSSGDGHGGEGWCLQDLSLSLAPGELLGLLGPSGCGKTTLLRLIAGFERPSRGLIRLDGREVAGPHHWLAPERRGVGMVFQDYALFPHLTAWQNACFGLPRGPRSARSQGQERVRWLLSLLGLEGLEQRYPHALSGGQRQRLALARALAPSPRLLLLDEPFSNLDGEVRLRLRRDLPALLRQCQTSAVLVTHDPQEALAICDRIAVLSAGRLEQCARPQELVTRPATAFVARFVMQANVIPARMDAGVLHSAWGPWRASGPDPIPALCGDGPVELVLLDEALVLEPDPAGRARVLGREFHGHHWQLHGEDRGCPFTLSLPLDRAIEPGQSCRLRLTQGAKGILFPGGLAVEAC